MIRDFVAERIKAIKEANRPMVDGYTYEEWEVICGTIGAMERVTYCALDVWMNGIDASFPYWRSKYPELFPAIKQEVKT
jgi:hypothetical protein